MRLRDVAYAVVVCGGATFVVLIVLAALASAELTRQVAGHSSTSRSSA